MSETFLIVGLGNPGRDYRDNRHNIGFMVLDALAARLNLSFSRFQFKALVTSGEYGGNKFILAKPQTYMNLSDQAVVSILRFYKLPLSNFIVANDDLDLPLGTIRIRPSGGSAGQKGVNSIIENLGTQDFPRLRLGIGRPPGQMQAADYVLQNFGIGEMTLVNDMILRAVDAVLLFTESGLNAAMTKYNGHILED
ncbi:MAG: aminoacyl-tRNA hydrolase [Chloroflexota bacterium]